MPTISKLVKLHSRLNIMGFIYQTLEASVGYHIHTSIHLHKIKTATMIEL